jgi:hypothetical protein
VEAIPAVPGVRAMLRAPDGAWLGANPLLDRWVRFERGTARTVDVTGELDPRVVPVRVGEALIFTTLMAPANSAEGPRSRFTCEACHFEGYGDGRRHHTGRGDLRVVTKPLLGLAGNKPHFTRALDPDLASVAMNEFRVATAGNAYDSWFSIDTSEHPWVRELGVQRASLSPEELRHAFMTFLLAFSHRPNPIAFGRDHFTALERRGADLFAVHCEGCHASRLLTDSAETRVPQSEWEASIFSAQAPIVWARAGYDKTGVTPYVHAEGARPSSLRRLAKKTPLFTSGEHASLEGLLAAVRVGPDAFFHRGAESATVRPLKPAEREALLAFLRLL